MKHHYYICDVFTDRRFGGNQLAVLPEAQGLTAEQMQQVAREFNFSETAFVFPPEAGQTRLVRIFTPRIEVPFAGHPNIGTAYTLAVAGCFGEFDTSTNVTFEEKAGLVRLTVHRRSTDSLWCELAAPESLSIGQTVPTELLAAAISLEPADIVTDTHSPRVASVGLPFLFAELSDLSALRRARINMAALDTLVELDVTPDVHLYIQSGDEFDIRARMFCPMDGVPEDPATGSANCALAGLLCQHAPAKTASLNWRIAQGVEIGRPSLLETRAEKKNGTMTGTWVGGESVLVSEGWIEVD